MEHFAKQNYYDSIIGKIAAIGGRFLSQVQTSTEQFPYHVTVTSARDTQLVFDVPGKALFVVFTHHELYGFLGSELENHWSIDIDCEYQGYEKLYTSLIGTFDNPSDFITETVYTFHKLEGVDAGSSSRCEQHLSFTSDVSHDDDKVIVPENTVVAVAGQILAYQSTHDYLADKFTDLSPSWHPHYTFKEMVRGISNRNVEEAVKTHFWTEFAKNGVTNASEVVREKIGKGH